MIRAIALVTMLAALSACAQQPPAPPSAKGSWEPLNVGKWDFQDNALTQPPVDPGRQASR